MKSIVADGRFYRSIKAYAESAKLDYTRLMVSHVNAGGARYFYLGHCIRLATDDEAAELETGDYVGTKKNAGESSSRRAEGPLITKPVTVGISTNWGNY